MSYPFLVVIIGLVVMVTVWLITIIRLLIQRKGENVLIQYKELYTEGEMSVIIKKSQELYRKNEPVRDVNTQSFFDFISKEESIDDRIL